MRTGLRANNDDLGSQITWLMCGVQILTLKHRRASQTRYAELEKELMRCGSLKMAQWKTAQLMRSVSESEKWRFSSFVDSTMERPSHLKTNGRN